MYRYLIASTLALGALTAVPAFAAQPVAAASAQASQLKAQDVVRHYSALVYANYSDSIAAAQKMQKAIDAFVAKPSQAKPPKMRHAKHGCKPASSTAKRKPSASTMARSTTRKALKVKSTPGPWTSLMWTTWWAKTTQV